MGGAALSRYISYSYTLVDGVTLTASIWNGVFSAIWGAFDTVQSDVDAVRAEANADKANQLRYSGLTANYNAAGYRVTGAANAINAQDYVTLAQLTAASMSSTLPSYSGFAGRSIRTTGSTVFWASDSPSAVSYTYNGSGQVTGITETVDGYQRTTTLTYNADGTVNTEAVTWHGVTRTRTFSYSNGQCTGSTEV